MQYRAITQQEHTLHRELCAQCFNENFDREKEDAYSYGEPGDKHLTARGAFTEDGMLVASLMLIPYTQYFDGHVVGMGGIAGVCTLPAHRRQGHIRELFKLIFREMYDKGDTFSYLYPFSHAYYRQFGYEVAGAINVFRIPFTALIKHRFTGTAEQFLPETFGDRASDPTPIVEIYEKWAPNYNLTVDRDGQIWRAWLERDPFNARWRTYLLRDEQGEPLAYVSYQIKGDTLVVEDYAWARPEGLHQIAAFICGLRGAGLSRVEWGLPCDLAPEILVPDLMEVNPERRPRGSVRIINAQQALELLRRPGLPGEVVIRIHDEWIPENNAAFRLHLNNNTVERTDAPADLELSIAAASQLLVGYCSLAQVLLRGDATLHGNEALLAALLPQKPVLIADNF